MKTLLGLIATLVVIIALGQYINYSNPNPYEEGRHFGYTIKCRDGYVYKFSNQRVNRYSRKFQVLNSDGTPLKCGQKIY